MDYNEHPVRRAVLIAAAGLIVLLIAFSIIRENIIWNVHTKVYNLLEEEKYKKAEELMKHGIMNGRIYDQNKNGERLFEYCLAKERYADTAWRAHSFIPAKSMRKREYFKYFTDEQYSEIMKFYDQVEAEYAVFRAEWEEKKENEYRERVRNNPPFVGMKEEDIRKTCLGSPSNVRHNRVVMRGEQYWDNIYDFSSGGRVIFTARCRGGEVTSVWDKRNVKIVHIPQSDLRSSSSDDPYNASDYSNAEDFYDDNYYDFMDYYEAEDYYNEHCE